MFAAIDQGIAMGAGFIELPSGFAQAPGDRLEEADVAVTAVRWW